MSFNKTTTSDGRISQYHSPLNTIAYKNRSTSDEDSAEKQQLTTKTQGYSHNLFLNIPNMHLATKIKQQEAIITEDSPRIEAEDATRHNINYFQDKLLTAREGSLCFRKALEKESFTNHEHELILQLRSENIHLRKHQQFLNEKISALEKEKLDLLSTLDRTERSLQETMKSNRYEQSRLDRRLESYREMLHEGIQLSSKRPSIDKGTQARIDRMVSGNSILEIEDLLLHIQNVERFSLDLIESYTALQAELENIKLRQHEVIEIENIKRFSDRERELNLIKQFVTEKFLGSYSRIDKRTENSTTPRVINKGYKISDRENKQNKIFVPSAIKALCLGNSISSLKQKIT